MGGGRVSALVDTSTSTSTKFRLGMRVLYVEEHYEIYKGLKIWVPDLM